jgi:hypothetical protein
VLAFLGPWSQHISKVSRDDLGRWVSAMLTGSDGDSFTIFSLYNVVDAKLHDSGPSMVYSQQYRLLRLAGVTHPKPRQQCVDDLNHEIKKLVVNGETIAVLGAFNEAPRKNPRLITSVCAEHHLFDAHAHFLGDNADIPTYARGSKRLDYCLVSAQIEQYIGDCGFNWFNEYIHSDHRAFFVDFRLKDFFGHGTPRLARPDQPFVSTSSPDVTKFITKMYSHLSENKAFNKYQGLYLAADVVEQPWQLANKLDRIIGQAFVTSGSHCSKKTSPPCRKSKTC